MNIVFTGQTGTNKGTVIENLALRIRKEYGHNEAPKDQPSQNFLSVYNVEDAVAAGSAGFTAWLKLTDAQRQLRQWERGFKKLLATIDHDDADNRFLSMHSIFFRRSRFFSPVNWQQLREFGPDLFITLIDDVYHMWWNIWKARRVFPRSPVFRLREIMAWRSAEIMMADALAKNLFFDRELPHYVVAVKHPTDMLVRLICEPEVMRMYAAYPITRTRDYERKREKVDSHRRKLHKRYVVFDPVTIDERVLETTLDRWDSWDEKIEGKPRPEKITIRHEDRWPIRSLNLPLLIDGIEYPNAIEVPDPTEVREIVEVLKEVNKHIVWRDFWLIDQGQVLAAYRPYYEGELSRGVSAEIQYAGNTGTHHVYIYHPDEDIPKSDLSSTLSHSPFEAEDEEAPEPPTTKYNEFLRELEVHQEQLFGLEDELSHWSRLIGGKREL